VKASAANLSDSKMAFHEPAGASSRPFQYTPFEDPNAPNTTYPTRPTGSDFDIFEWYPHFQSCYKYFLDHAQHDGPVQAVATFINIMLPYQKQPNPIFSSSSSASSQHSGPSSHSGGPMGITTPLRSTPLPFGNPQAPPSHTQTVSVIPYLRRLVATGFDRPGVLHGFFGDSWVAGIGPLHEIERRNYLFAAKSENWLNVKATYDMSPSETIPFMKPLQRATEEEIANADREWSNWLAMQDWMVGPRAPPSDDAMEEVSGLRSPMIKSEPRV
jgi:hypothetical protein